MDKSKLLQKEFAQTTTMRLIVTIPLAFLLLATYTSGQLQYNYAQVIQKSLLFYEAQRSGRLPTGNRIPWRGDTFLNDRGLSSEDLTGGYFDGKVLKAWLMVKMAFGQCFDVIAGDFVKFGFPFASAMTMFAWGLVDSAEGFRKAGEWNNAVAGLRWGMDYMIKVKEL